MLKSTLESPEWQGYHNLQLRCLHDSKYTEVFEVRKQASELNQCIIKENKTKQKTNKQKKKQTNKKPKKQTKKTKQKNKKKQKKKQQQKNKQKKTTK